MIDAEVLRLRRLRDTALRARAIAAVLSARRTATLCAKTLMRGMTCEWHRSFTVPV